jgi:probable HAF family extracellular repeat protein
MAAGGAGYPQEGVPMPNTSSRLIPVGSLLLALSGSGCSPDEPPTGPSAEPAGTTASAVTYVVRDLGMSGVANAINNRGVIVGGSGHAFVWQNGVKTDLGTLAGGRASAATAINDNGVIVGWSTIKSGDTRAVRWINGVKKNLGTLGGRNSEARSVNHFGVIVGWSETASGDRHAFVWKNGVMTDLGTLGGNFSQAEGINRSGVIVGRSTTASGEQHAFRWKDGVFKDLGTQGRMHSLAFAINTRGQIAGALGPHLDAAGEELDFADGFVYFQEAFTNNVGGGFNRPTTFPRAISSEGVVVGQAFDTGDDPGAEQAWVWENGKSAVLPVLDPTITLDNHAGALGVNRAGTIVGFSWTKSGGSHAVMWRRR